MTRSLKTPPSPSSSKRKPGLTSDFQFPTFRIDSDHSSFEGEKTPSDWTNSFKNFFFFFSFPQLFMSSTVWKRCTFLFCFLLISGCSHISSVLGLSYLVAIKLVGKTRKCKTKTPEFSCSLCFVSQKKFQVKNVLLLKWVFLSSERSWDRGRLKCMPDVLQT